LILLDLDWESGTGAVYGPSKEINLCLKHTGKPKSGIAHDPAFESLASITLVAKTKAWAVTDCMQEAKVGFKK